MHGFARFGVADDIPTEAGELGAEADGGEATGEQTAAQGCSGGKRCTAGKGEQKTDAGACTAIIATVAVPGGLSGNLRPGLLLGVMVVGLRARAHPERVEAKSGSVVDLGG